MPQQDALLKFFAEFIESELGIVYAEHNYFQLQNRLDEIRRELGLTSVEGLHQLAVQQGFNGRLRRLLLDTATNNETSFFRDSRVFNAIESEVLPGLAGAGQGRQVSIWSAASSSGQECLSLVMLILEWFRRGGQRFEFQVQASDISERIMAKAKAATYSELEIQRGLSPELRERYFTRTAGGLWAANQDLRARIEYYPLNLTEPFPKRQPFHLVLCRNVLIYQKVDSKRVILEKIAAVMATDGVLVLGSGESLIGLSEDFSQVIKDGCVLYRRKQRTAGAA